MATITDNSRAIHINPAEDYYIFKLSEDVTREKVYYPTRYGIETAADLYYAKNLDKSIKHRGLVVGPPFGGVKEQGPGVYANELAQRGFVVVAFDPAYHGYSGGQPRYTGSPDTYVEDFSAAVDFIGSLDYVDRDRIGALGICASGGFALSATAQDSRIKAVATSVMYDIPGLAGMATGEARAKMLENYSEQRWDDFRNPLPKYEPHYPEHPVSEIPDNITDTNQREFFSFYGTKRGWHPHALVNITEASNPSFMNFQSTNHLDEISPRPALLVTSKEAHSQAFSEATYQKLKEPKELYVAPKGQHVDFYDNKDGVVPFDKFEKFFKENL